MPTRQEVEAEKQAALNKGTSCPIFPLAVRLRVRETPREARVHIQGGASPPQALHLRGRQGYASLRSRLPCVPVCGAHWLPCLLAVGIVPPRTKSPTDEEVTPSRVLRRNANGLANGLASRVSAHPWARELVGTWAGLGSQGPCEPTHLSQLKKPRARGGK